MAEQRLLLLSNSTNYGGTYLAHAKDAIKDFLGRVVTSALFVPYAGVRFTPEAYTSRVRPHFQDLGYRLEAVHEADDLQQAVRSAEALVVGGGNTFHLLRRLYDTGLLAVLRERVTAGVPYIGWSAGANIVCPTIKTTNDMPIVEPPSLQALDLLPFQINPHYTAAALAGYQGETRAERIAEFLDVNPGVYVVGLPEGSMLRIEGATITLLGTQNATVFLSGTEATEYTPTASLQFLW